MKPKAKALRTAPAKKQRKPVVRAPKVSRKNGSSRKGAMERYRIFVEAYIANGANGTQAAISAGYSPRTAYSQACNLLKHHDVQALLESRRAELRKKFSLETDNVLQACAAIIFADLALVMDERDNLIPIRAWPKEMRMALASIDRGEFGGIEKVKLADRNSSIEKAMKHLGLFKEDNTQKKDPMTQLMEHIAAHNKGMQVVP